MTEAIVAGVLGWVLQWAKGPKKVPTWLAYCVFGIVAIAAYIYVDRQFLPGLKTDWRDALGPFVIYVAGIEGFTALSRKAKIAPRTDSL